MQVFPPAATPQRPAAYQRTEPPRLEECSRPTDATADHPWTDACCHHGESQEKIEIVTKNSPQYGSPYASVPLTYSPYLPGLVSPGLLQGSDQTAVLQQSPPPLQHQPPQQIQQQPAKQRNDRIEVRVRPINLLSKADTQPGQIAN